MVQSRVTRRGRTTVPASTRAAFGLTDGDRIGWRIDAGRAILTRVDAADAPFATFDERDSPADRAACANL
jgi:bifunctional DNA-binding transcriptional regulator/antitoxin component of YhaV-PrlF toxin-antitoxin module